MRRKDTGEMERIIQPARLDQLFECCPTCKYPYTVNFTGYEYVLTGQPVCGGSPVLGLCLPTVYLCFSAPLSSIDMVAKHEGRTYRGIMYAVAGQERIDDDG